MTGSLSIRPSLKLVLLALIFTIPAYSSDEGTQPDLTAIDARQACEKISAKLSSVSLKECLRHELQTSGYFSVKNFPLLLKEFPPLKGKTPKGKILLIGGTHGDELSSISVVFKWMNTLNKHHSGLFHWHIFPLMNPDGALRKRQTRVNSRGVDLNRNFQTPDIEGAALSYWKQRTKENKRRYPGQHPLSEPESRWLHEEIQSFQPDVIISVHAPYSLVDFDAPNRSNAPKKIGYLYKNLMGTYPGSLGNYAGIYLGIPVITLELPHAGIMPTKNQISHLWRDLIRWLIKNL